MRISPRCACTGDAAGRVAPGDGLENYSRRVAHRRLFVREGAHFYYGLDSIGKHC